MHAVIMAGGAGTRFWPASRRRLPKQLMDFWGEPLIRRSVRNIAAVVPPERQWVITGQELVQGVAHAAPELDRSRIIGEPVGRNTAPCVGLAACILEEMYGDCCFGLFPSDHSIRDLAAWERCLRDAFAAASDSDAIVTLGIRPTRPETGYGYIEIDESDNNLGEQAKRPIDKELGEQAKRPIDKELGEQAKRPIDRELGEQAKRPMDKKCIPVRRFVEKPNRERAESYLSSGRFLWNAGIFFCRTSTMLAEIERQMPALFEGLQALRAAWREGRFEQAMEELYPRLPSQSIDYGVMENARQVLVIPATFGWTDLGHWAALDEDFPADEQGNVALGSTLLLDCKDSVVVDTLASSRKVVALGVDELVIVDTADALLVCPKARVQEVRRVVDALSAEGREDLL
ncbi:MAG: sugar phosphate nucleotidyltransferase [Myxococcota bacterium]|jgi:mannose-1-phosphate guanylyltransferase|nr:sugar phosphate nucleotidyltransferase [Myxococcota bacterium]